ncbi:MAG: hypothetical protein QM737_22595 [Ferruginibacter sp.]
MADNILLIPASKVKQQTIIESNVDDEMIANITFQVQEMQLKPVLGKELYDTLLTEVLNQIEDSNYEIPEQYQNLLSIYIKPFLLTAITSEFAFVNSYKVTNKGLLKMNDNSANAVSAAEIETLRNYYNNQLSVHKANLIKYLKDNNLTTCGTDKAITSPAIGWYFDLN